MCWLLASDDQSMRGSASYYSECSGFISSRIDWFDLFAVQGTLKSLPITAVQNDQFFSAQSSLWSNSHICTRLLEKTTTLTIQCLLVDLIKTDMPLELSAEKDSGGAWSTNPFIVLSSFVECRLHSDSSAFISSKGKIQVVAEEENTETGKEQSNDDAAGAKSWFLFKE